MKFRLGKSRSGLCLGAIEIPTNVPGVIVASAIGTDRADALARAALVAERIASDPVMQALMPPQAMAAIKAAKGLAAAAKMGSKPLRSVWRSLRGPGKQRLAKVLHAEAVKAEATDDAENAVGFLPLAMIAAKYGPDAARKAQAMYKARKRKKAAARNRAAAARKRDEGADEGADQGADEGADEGANQGADQGADQGTESIDGAPATPEWTPGHGRWMPDYFADNDCDS